jgi:hypothetical protein
MNLQLLRSAIIDYPSASAIEYYNRELYVIGDDIHYIQCLNEDWSISKRIYLFEFEGARIPKPVKPDLESAVIFEEKLYIAGSGSLSPQRDVAFLVDLRDATVKKINTASFYNLFRERHLIGEMNIEASAVCGDRLLMFNRANAVQPNYLLVSDLKILKKQLPDRFKTVPVKTPLINNIPLGISGACYDEKKDILFLSASAENTSNAYDDGEVSGSAIGILRYAYSKIDNYFEADEWILLDAIDARFRRQKIESICMLNKRMIATAACWPPITMMAHPHYLKSISSYKKSRCNDRLHVSIFNFVVPYRALS